MRIAALFILLAAALAAQPLRITGGVRDDQVLQRDTAGKADITVSGTAEGADGKSIEARLTRGILPVLGFTWRKLGTVADGKWSVTLAKVPSGGPYRLETRVAGSKETATVERLLVGDLWVLGGQSNMQGIGDLIAVQQPDDKVHMLDMVDERWQIAKEPLHNLPGSVDRVHWPLNAEKQPERYIGAKLAEYNEARKKGAGLGLPFGVTYVKEADVPVGLIPCAHSGTSMDQWDPARWDKANPGDSLYGSMMRRVGVAGGKVKGVLWYQGEADANPKVAPEFKGKFERFVARVREDFGDPNLPFYYVQIGRHINNSNVEQWNDVQEAQRVAEESIPNTAVFASVDSELDDGIHVGTDDLKRLGRIMALHAAGKAKRGPRVESVKREENTLLVTFAEVNGRLVSPERINGFSIHGPTGEMLPMIYKAKIHEGKPNMVILSFGGKLPEGATLRYGYGKDPYCNLRDEKGFGVPVFGLLPIQ